MKRKSMAVLAVVLLAVAADAAEKRKRDFPGAEDEEELKVQNELPQPPLKLDRRTLEQKALQGFLKSSEAQAPSSPEKKQ